MIRRREERAAAVCRHAIQAGNPFPERRLGPHRTEQRHHDGGDAFAIELDDRSVQPGRRVVKTRFGGDAPGRALDQDLGVEREEELAGGADRLVAGPPRGGLRATAGAGVDRDGDRSDHQGASCGTPTNS